MKICKGLFLYIIFTLSTISGFILPQIALANPTDIYVSSGSPSAIQQAIDDVAKSGGGTVYVELGTYSLTAAISMKNGVSLIGAGADVCTLVGAAGNPVILCQNITNTNTTIAGFTITHPVTNPVTYGRGIECHNACPTIRNNIITANNAKYGGGGILCDNLSSAYIDNNIICANSALEGGGGEGGGGIYCYNSSPSITNNTITGNTSKFGGGGILCEYNSSPDITNNRIEQNKASSLQNNWLQGGGGILCLNTSPTIKNNTITGNSADYTGQQQVFPDVGGGGILCCDSRSSQTKIISNTITDNSTGSRGGGISCYKDSSPTIVNNVIARNTAGYHGGGISCESSSPSITNNTITKNTASKGNGGGIFCNNSSSSITNNIIANNDTITGYPGGGIYKAGIYSLNISYNDVYGNITLNYIYCNRGTGDINPPSDPLFVDINVGNYHLEHGSLCIDSGDNLAEVLGEITFDLNGKPWFANIPYDLDGKPRLADGDSDGTFFIDMGAYEYSITITASAGLGGTISPSGIITVNYGSNYVFTITAATGYRIADVKVDGESVGAVGSYPFSNIITSHTIEATFVKTCTISGTVTAGAAGLAGVMMSGLPGSPSTDINGQYSGTVDYGWSDTVTPIKAGYTFTPSSQNYSDVTLDQTMDYIYEINTYSLSINITGTGTGSVAESVREVSSSGPYAHGTEVTLTANPDVTSDFVGWSGDLSGAVNPTTITMDGPKTATATFNLKQYALTVTTAGTGTGSVAESVREVSSSGPYNHGTVVTLTATPAANSEFAGWSGDLSGATNPATIKMDSDKTVTATFKLKQYTIEASAGPGGTISPSGSVSVSPGDNITFKISSTEGYHIADVIVDGKSVRALHSYTFNNVTSNHSISAVFGVNTCIIIASAGEGGIITPAGRVTVNYGGSQTFAIVPNDGYHIARVRVDGKSKGVLSSYTFTNVTTNHTIKVRFTSDFVRAVVVIHPDTLNLKSEGDENTITADINLPRRHHEANIDMATVKLDVMGTTVPALMTHSSKDDHRAAGRIVKFSRQAVISALGGRTGNIVMTVSGQLKDGTIFSGSDTVKVIDQGKKKGSRN